MCEEDNTRCITQTHAASHQNLGVQTEAPPSTTFALTVSPAEIHDAYLANYKSQLEEEMEREMEETEQEIERDRDRDRGTKGRGVSEGMNREGRNDDRHAKDKHTLASIRALRCNYIP